VNASERPVSFLAVTGPTASGKTDLSLALAEHLEIEIISMDSRQVYAGMDIGTDKVLAEDREQVPHHGLDLVQPDARYSAGQFARDVRRWVDEISKRGRIPVLAGGTGFFLKVVMEPIFVEPPMQTARVEALRSYLKRQDPSLLARWVQRLDPDRAPLAIEGGAQRMSRTLEVALLTGVALSRWHREAPAEAEGIAGMVVVLDLPRAEIHRRIDDRVNRMVERGLLEEVRGLLDAGYGGDTPGMTGTGYREVIRHLEGEITLEEAMEEIRANTRRYARRQITWFRNQLPASVLRVDATAPLEDQVRMTLDAWRTGGGAPYRGRGGGSS
jgi:tRNA dimethylallyltransferase